MRHFVSPVTFSVDRLKPFSSSVPLLVPCSGSVPSGRKTNDTPSSRTMAQPAYFSAGPMASYPEQSQNGQLRLHALSVEEVFNLKAQFAVYDADGNGFLTVAELQNMLRVMNFHYNDTFIMRLFAMTFAMRGRMNKPEGTTTDLDGIGGDAGAQAVAELISRGLTIDDVMLFMQIFLTINDIVIASIQREFDVIVQGRMTLSAELLRILTSLVDMDESENISLAAVRNELLIAMGMQPEPEPTKTGVLEQKELTPSPPPPSSHPTSIADQRSEASVTATVTQESHSSLPPSMNLLSQPGSQAEPLAERQAQESQVPPPQLPPQSPSRPPRPQLHPQGGATPRPVQPTPSSDDQVVKPATPQRPVTSVAKPQPPTLPSLLELDESDIALLRERARLLDEENDYLDQSVALFSYFFDPQKRGSLSVSDARRCLNALGLPPSEAPLKLLSLKQADGRVTLDQLKNVYRYLLVLHASKGIEMHRIRAYFQQIDSNGDGVLTHTEFAGGVQDLFNQKADDALFLSESAVPGLSIPQSLDYGGLIAARARARQVKALRSFPPTITASTPGDNPQRLTYESFRTMLLNLEEKGDNSAYIGGLRLPETKLTARDAELLFALADLDENGTISLEEFIYLFGQLGGAGAGIGGDGATTVTQRLARMHDPMTPIPTNPMQIQQDVALLLLLKLIRAKLPSPLESLYDFMYAPAHYRTPLFSILDGHPWYTLAAKVSPKLDHTGTGFANLRPNPALAVEADPVSNSKPTGAAGMGKVFAAVVHSSSAAAIPLNQLLPLPGSVGTGTGFPSHVERLERYLLRAAAPLRPLPTSLSTKESSGGGSILGNIEPQSFLGSLASLTLGEKKRATSGPGITEPPLALSAMSITCRILDSMRSTTSISSSPAASSEPTVLGGSAATMPSPPGTSLYHASIATGIAAAGIVRLPPSAAAVALQRKNNQNQLTHSSSAQDPWKSTMVGSEVAVRAPSVTAAAQAQALSTLQEASAGSWLSANPTVALRGDELGRWGEFIPACALEVTMLSVEGLPSPAPRIADSVAGARIRVLLFDNRRPVSNMHTVKAKFAIPGAVGGGKLRPNELTTDIGFVKWQFPDTVPEPNPNGDVDWHQFVVKTDRPNTSLVFELSLLLRRRDARAGQTSTLAVNAMQRSHRNLLLGHSHAPSDYYELSAGWAQLDISLQDLLDTGKLPIRDLDLPIHAGSFFAAEAVNPAESVGGDAVTSGTPGYAQRRQGKLPDPVLKIRVTPVELIKAGRRIQQLIMHAPVDAIFPTNTVRVVRLARELIRDELAEGLITADKNTTTSSTSNLSSGNAGDPLGLPSSHTSTHTTSSGSICSLSTGAVSSWPLQVLNFILSQQDALQAFAELWQRARKTIPSNRRRDDGGSSSSSTRELFRRSLIKLLPMMSASSRVLPPLIVGVTDLIRLAFFRSVADDTTDPFVALANDTLRPGWVRGRGLVSDHVTASIGTLQSVAPAVMNEMLVNYVAQNFASRLRAVDLLEEEASDRVFSDDMYSRPLSRAYYLTHRPFDTSEVVYDSIGRLSEDRWRVLNHTHAIQRTHLVEVLQSSMAENVESSATESGVAGRY